MSIMVFKYWHPVNVSVHLRVVFRKTKSFISILTKLISRRRDYWMSVNFQDPSIEYAFTWQAENKRIRKETNIFLIFRMLD